MHYHTVTCPNGKLKNGLLTVSDAEAVALIKRLNKSRAENKSIRSYAPPRIVQGGCLTRSSFYEFLSQFHGDNPRSLEQRAGGLYGKLVRYGFDNKFNTAVKLRVICPLCQRNIARPCEKDNNPSAESHAHNNYTAYLINAASLKASAETFATSGMSRIGDKMKEDVRLFALYLT